MWRLEIVCIYGELIFITPSYSHVCLKRDKENMGLEMHTYSSMYCGVHRCICRVHTVYVEYNVVADC